MRIFQILAIIFGLHFAGPVMAADECVRRLQTIFNDAGFNAGTPDGLPGRKTYAAGATYREVNTDVSLPELTKATTRQWCDTLIPIEPAQVLVITEGVSDRMKLLIDEGLQAAETLALEVFGVAPRQETTIFASSDAVWLATNYLDANNLPQGYRAGKEEGFGTCNPPAEFAWYSVFLCMSSDTWTKYGPDVAKRIVAHEFWHVIQSDLIGPKAKGCCDHNAMSVYGPEWLKEGSAQWFGLRTIAELGLINLEKDVRWHTRILPDDLHIFDRNSRKGYRDNSRDVSENMGVVATHFLVTQSGENALSNFYRQIGYGNTWEASFEIAFGQTPEQFEVDFEAYVKRVR